MEQKLHFPMQIYDTYLAVMFGFRQCGRMGYGLVLHHISIDQCYRLLTSEVTPVRTVGSLHMNTHVDLQQHPLQCLPLGHLVEHLCQNDHFQTRNASNFG